MVQKKKVAKKVIKKKRVAKKLTITLGGKRPGKEEVPETFNYPSSMVYTPSLVDLTLCKTGKITSNALGKGAKANGAAYEYQNGQFLLVIEEDKSSRYGWKGKNRFSKGAKLPKECSFVFVDKFTIKTKSGRVYDQNNFK